MNTASNIADLGNTNFDGTRVLTGFAANAFWHIQKIDTKGDRAFEVRWFAGKRNAILSFYAADMHEVGVTLQKMAEKNA